MPLTNPPAGRALQPPARPLPPRILPAMPPYVGGNAVRPAGRPERCGLAVHRLAAAGLRFARWGRAAARPLVSSHSLADRSASPSLPHKPPRRPLGGFSTLPMRNARSQISPRSARLPLAYRLRVSLLAYRLRIRLAYRLRQKPYGMPLATLDLICSAFATQI